MSRNAEIQPTIVLSELTTGYQPGRKAVVVSKGLTASLEAGTFTCLLGANGAGKSTLLRTLAGFMVPLSGNIGVMGKSGDKISRGEWPRLLSVVLTSKVTATNMSVSDLVSLGRAPYTGFWGRLADFDREMIDRSIKLVGIEELRERAVATLSDGERQKAMIAKALAQDTPIILLDEATAFLDYPGKIDIMRLLRRLAHTEGKTVFMSTHDLPLALETADGLWLLDKRFGLSQGTPETLAANGDIARYFDRGDVVFDPATRLFTIPE